MDVTIALDAMGGDHGPTEILPAALHVLKKHKNLHLVLVGQEEVLLKTLADNNAVPNERISIQHASETVEMHELPSRALRRKKDSSMRVAINMVQNSMVQACVSAGNTGALMAISRFVLKMLPGIDRPAICSTMPEQGPDNTGGLIGSLVNFQDLSNDPINHFSIFRFALEYWKI